ncbi:rhodanese-like domain-containing protein [Noviherbaspirillum malthae]|jgi:rhodanese-related sulfurtransferase|uniref:rhodanese-like domain-containing protein n=1 Tax=Noviherbaspirillum malthae TaxID=1260987 RepID=UPI00188DF02F|nr:rhodanese-like domain-containing protein [Noviherbaspirillum malthae]
MQAQLQHYLDKLAYEIDSWDLSVALRANERLIVIDTRAPELYAREHIPGAINLPHRTMSEDTTRGFDRDALVVSYCDGIGCNGSTKGALNMTRLGFKVKELIGGLDWWKRDGHPTAGVQGSQGDSEIICGC